MKCKDCNVIGCPNRGSNAVFSKPCNIINQYSFDWQFFRNQAAKDILCAMIARGEKVKDIVISIAIDGADKLIKELKEEERE